MTLSGAFRPGVYAAIDLGTVTCRVLVARVQADGTVETLARGYRVCNLGEGVDATGRLSGEAMARVCDAVAAFIHERDAFAGARTEPIPTLCVATSAARDAANADEFRACLEALGVHLAVISGEREAALSFAGAGMDFVGERVAVVDIGGGSTEIIAGQGGKVPEFARSFDIGCRRMTERFFADDPPTADQIAAARTWARTTIAGYVDEVRGAGYEGARIVAVAGTATSVVSVDKAMAVYDPAEVHGVFVSRELVARQLACLAAMDVEARRHVVGLDPKRAEVVVAGLVILDEILAAFDAAGYVASETDLLQGAVLSLARES